MLLLQLPAEILIQIMDHVGPSCFREDLGRLTLSKQWYEYACAACYEHLQLSEKTLARLMSSRYKQETFVLVRNNLRFLDLEMKGFKTSSTEPGLRAWYESGANHADWMVLGGWIGHLRRELLQLVSTATLAPKWRAIRVQALDERVLPYPMSFPLDDVFLYLMKDLLSATHLRVLDLDITADNVIPYRRESIQFGPHACARIGAHLPTLKRLRLRMPKICPDVLKLDHHGAKSQLTEVLINLSLSNEQSTTPAAHATHCRHTDGAFLQLKTDIEKQAQDLAAQMEDPKVFRILTHEPSTLDMHTLDILTGKHMKLIDDMEWDADGEIIEDVEEHTG